MRFCRRVCRSGCEGVGIFCVGSICRMWRVVCHALGVMFGVERAVMRCLI